MNNTNDIKKMFITSMKIVWRFGIGNNSYQHRDMIRIYFMGIMDILHRLNNKEEALKYIDDFELISQENWFPDDSWKWWSNPESN